MTIITEGQIAPNFSLPVAKDYSVSLEEYRGKPVILVFYPADWSPVCSDQLSLYNELLPEFRKYDAEILGISVDGLWCHLAFSKAKNLHFPLLSDFHPQGAVSKSYGIYQEDKGNSGRALFVINEDGIIAWSYESPSKINPGAEGILFALEKLKKQKE